MNDSNSTRATRRNATVRAAVLAAILGGAAAVAQADTPAKTPDGSLTMYGITFYGTIDIGFQYDSHSAPISDYFPTGTGELIQKNGNTSQTTVVGSNLGQSKFGFQGREEFGNGFAGIFKLETFFNPWSGQISDALKSLTENNGVAAASQQVGVDSSIAGQLFGGAAYAGVTHVQYGTLTFGRQTGLLADGIGKYDPLMASNAFSVLGFSGTPAGGGDTEDRRLDSSVKYDVTYDGFHFGVHLQPKTGTNPGTTDQIVLGWNFPGGSVDAFWVQKNDAIAAGSLSAGQVATLNCAYTYSAPGGLTPAGISPTCGNPVTGVGVTGGGGNALDKSLSGTISDNTVFSVMAKYSFKNKVSVFGGYEHIQYSNPTTRVAAGQQIIGGYVLAYVNNAAYNIDKVLQVAWVGARYPVNPKLDLMGGYYYWQQNSYTAAHPNCSSAAVASQCSGAQNAASFVADYHFTKRFDGYFGVMWSEIGGGLANGALQTSNIDPTIGVKYQF